MKAHVVLDSGFLIATIASGDLFHDNAVLLFEEFKVRKDSITLIVPPLVITLRRKGLSAKHVEEIVMRFVNLPYASVLALSEMSAFKHMQRLTVGSQVDAMRTSDFMIFCVGMDFDATIVTLDYKMMSKCKSAYPSTYFPSNANGRTDETADILTDIDFKLGEDVNSPTYTALKTSPF